MLIFLIQLPSLTIKMFLCRSAVTMASMEEIPIVEETNGDQINDYEQLVKLGIDGRVVAKLQEVCGQGIFKSFFILFEVVPN